jgi:hypothetical protein
MHEQGSKQTGGRATRRSCNCPTRAASPRACGCRLPHAPQPQPGAVDVFLDFISYSGGPLPEQLLAQVRAAGQASGLWHTRARWPAGRGQHAPAAARAHPAGCWHARGTRHMPGRAELVLARVPLQVPPGVPVSILWGAEDPWEDMREGRRLFAHYPCVTGACVGVRARARVCGCGCGERACCCALDPTAVCKPSGPVGGTAPGCPDGTACTPTPTPPRTSPPPRPTHTTHRVCGAAGCWALPAGRSA